MEHALEPALGENFMSRAITNVCPNSMSFPSFSKPKKQTRLLGMEPSELHCFAGVPHHDLAVYIPFCSMPRKNFAAMVSAGHSRSLVGDIVAHLCHH